MINLHILDMHRVAGSDLPRRYGGWSGDDTCGAFVLPSPVDGCDLRIIASAEAGWDHVSVSREDRCPDWEEMQHIKRLFFKKRETAVQYHVPESDHVNCHPFCLHLWRYQQGEFPRPPASFVGPG